MPPDLPALAARDLLNELMRPTEWVSGCVGLDEPDAQRLIDAHAALVRAAALTEAEEAIRAQVGSPLASALFSNGVEFAADLVHDLATTAPTSQEG
jgi:hypothetical protein